MIHFNFSFVDLWTYIGPLVGGSSVKLLDHYLKVRRIKIFKKKDPVADSVKNNILIEHKIEEIREQFEADRVYLLQFHNGGNFYPSGRSILKFSVFYERTSPGCNVVGDKYQNIPVSIFAKFFNFLNENNVSYYHLLKKTEIDEFRGFDRDTDVKSSYCSSVKSIDGKLMGVLVIQYTKKKKVLAEDKIKEIQIHASSIGSTLHTYQENSK